MRRPRSTMSSITTATMALLCVVQLGHLVADSHTPYIAALLLTLLVLLVATTAKLHRDGCVESRMSAAVLALLSGGGVALTATIGLPGQSDNGLDALGAATLVLSVAALTTIALTARQQARETGPRSPYAL